jgi:hypothetical protein
MIGMSSDVVTAFRCADIHPETNKPGCIASRAFV